MVPVGVVLTHPGLGREVGHEDLVLAAPLGAAVRAVGVGDVVGAHEAVSVSNGGAVLGRLSYLN